MNKIILSRFRRMTEQEIKQVAPCEILANGEPIGIFIGNKNDVVVIADMHPRVQKQMKAKEASIRMGMPLGTYFSMSSLTERDEPIVDPNVGENQEKVS